MAARGLDVDDIDVVIHMACKQLDSFVHRSGRTARKGKSGLNIIFFDKTDFGFVFDLEKQLNINIDFAQQIDDGDDDIENKGRYGKYVDKLDQKSVNSNLQKKMRVDQNISSQIFGALACPDLEADKRQQYVQFLIDFYVSKSHFKLEPVGFISGKPNTETFGITDAPFKVGRDLKDRLTNEFGIRCRFESGN